MVNRMPPKIPLLLILTLLLITPATAYGGIHISSVSDITSSHATLNGYVDDPGSDPIAWFTLGTQNGTFGYRTANISTESGDFSLQIESYPLIAGLTYYARAECPNGNSSEVVSWTMLQAGTVPTTTYSTRIDLFQLGDMSLESLWETVVAAGGDIFGGGNFGILVFTTLFISVAFIVLFGRAGDVVIPLGVGVLVIGAISSLLMPELRALGYGLMVGAVLGIIYAIYRKT